MAEARLKQKQENKNYSNHNFKNSYESDQIKQKPNLIFIKTQMKNLQ
jgi:hypothetical protein